MTKSKLAYRSFCVVFFVIAIFCLGRYLHYVGLVVAFPYDWEPTDGDHLNFAHRIAQGLPIYLSMKAGQVLSIYAPLYHGLVALVGGASAGMSLARGISLLFWLLCPLTVFLYFYRKWGYFYSATAAILIALPSQPLLLLDIVQLGPNSTVAYLFLCTLLFAHHCVESESNAWWKWVLVGVMASLCYFAKQLGVIAIVSVMAFLLIRRVRISQMGLVVLGFLLTFSIAAGYLQLENSGQFFHATFLDLNQIIRPGPLTALRRLFYFLIVFNPSFTLVVLISFALVRSEFRRLSIWQVSFALHVPLLLKILGNAGGGETYFLTFWITMVLISVELMKGYEGKQLDVSTQQYPTTGTNTKQKGLRSGILWIALFVNFTIGAISVQREISDAIPPTAELEELMKDYYQAVGTLVGEKINPKVLVHRSIGAFVASNVNVENEGATMFSYAWFHPEIFDKRIVLTLIKEKKYDFIVTGLQVYPVDARNAIEANYKIVLTHNVNVYLGKVAPVSIYRPK